MFDPPVTTQFISNVERGVTPLPPAHVSTLTRALSIPEEELMTLLEREYAVKLTGRLGRPAEPISPASTESGQSLSVSTQDYGFMRSLYEAYLRADVKTRQTFVGVCRTILNLGAPPPNTEPALVAADADSSESGS